MTEVSNSPDNKLYSSTENELRDFVNNGNSSHSIIRKTKKELQREIFVDEIVDHLLLHQGCDSEGRAHPDAKRIKVDVLEAALEKARERGLNPDWQPYHFKGNHGTWHHSSVLDEWQAEIFRDIVIALVGPEKVCPYDLVRHPS